jgi:hypothetical protein
MLLVPLLPVVALALCTGTAWVALVGGVRLARFLLA